ncbi:MAG: HAD family hydrolase [Bacteroidetes bacterium]|nr:MAG: HAD family hydrolase [Bacteroidota bacterium]
MNKAIFLDRDGVINSDKGHYYIYKVEDFKINEGIVESLQKFQENNFLLIIISNQGGVSKGIYSIKDVEKVHEYLKSNLKKYNIELTEIYYCPHHSSNEKCLCRKPNTLMLEKAIARFNINVSESFLIGDGERDIEAGKKVGLHTIKIDANENISKYCKLIIND